MTAEAEKLPELKPNDDCRRCGKPRGAHQDDGLTRLLGLRCLDDYQRYAPKFRGGELELENLDKPVCPHCGEQCDMDDVYHLYEEGEHSLSCGGCERDYEVSTRVEYSFTSRKDADDDGK